MPNKLHRTQAAHEEIAANAVHPVHAANWAEAAAGGGLGRPVVSLQKHVFPDGTVMGIRAFKGPGGHTFVLDAKGKTTRMDRARFVNFAARHGIQVKLARPVDSSKWVGGLKDVEAKADAPFHQANIHDELADWLDDQNDPRAELVRRRHPDGVGGARWEIISALPTRGRKYTGANHTFPDGSILGIGRFVGKPHPGAKQETHWGLGWQPTGDNEARGTAYATHMTHDEFKVWMSRFDKETQKAIAHSFNTFNPIYPASPKFKLARMKAPAGGVIVNGQMQQGGKFLPRALQRIRDVIARKRGRMKLSRGHDKFHRPENYERITATGRGKFLHAGANDWESGWTWAGIHDEDDTKGDRPSSYIRVGHEKCPGCGGSLNAGSRTASKACQEFAKKVVARWAGKKKLARVRKTPPPDPVDVTTGAALDAAGVPRGPVDRAMTPEQLKAVEDFYAAHGLKDNHRLSSKIKVTKHGTISATNEQVGRFLEHVSKLPVSSRSLRRVLNSSRHEDPVRHAHLLLNLGKDTERAKEGTGADWYSGEIAHFDRELDAYMKLKPHERSLAKAVLAFTSGGQDPKLNTFTMLRMLRAGERNGDMFRNIPEANEHALKEWLERNPGLPPVPKEKGRELVDWGTKFGNGWTGDDEGRYKAGEARMVHAPGTEDHGKLLDYKTTEYDEEADADRVKWVPLRDDTGALFNKYKYSGKGPKAIRNVRVPIPDENGNLQPVGWTMRNQQVVTNLRRLHRLLDHFGGDRKAAADWLKADHPIAQIENVAGAKVDPGYIDTKETGGVLPGAFMFGPKFGPFFLNLHIPESPEYGKYLTADMWWARNWNRYLGNLFKLSKKGPKLIGAPTGKKERRAMWRAAQETARAAGLSSVAELQAALWYHEQGLWRLFGADNESYSYRHGIDAAKKMKLRRVR